MFRLQLGFVPIIWSVLVVSGTNYAHSQQNEKARKQAKVSLEWISRSQLKDGSWGSPNSAPGSHQISTTSFCAMALLASGDKKYERQIAAAASYVSNNLFTNRAIADSPKLKEQIRQQMLAMRAAKKKALEDLAKTDPQFAKIIAKALAEEPDPNEDFSLDDSNWKIAIGGMFICEHFASAKKKNPKFVVNMKFVNQLAGECTKRMEESGGWGHGPHKKNPLGYLEMEIMSSWMLATLGGCQRLGCKGISEKSIDKAVNFIEQCCKEGEGGVGYSPRFGQKGVACPCRTGGAIFALGLLKKTEHPLYERMTTYWNRNYEKSVGAHGSTSLGVLGSCLGARQISDEAYDKFSASCFPKVLEAANKDGTFQVIPEVSHAPKGGKEFKLSFSAGNAERFNLQNREKALDVGIYALSMLLERDNLAFLGKRFND